MKHYVPIPLPDHATFSDAEMIARAESFYDEFKRRHTVREFSPEPVPRAIINAALRTAGTAPSGANHQPWHFTIVADPDIRRQIRHAAEEEERRFYAGKAGEEWLRALGPLGTDSEKPFLEVAPWVIVIWGVRKEPDEDGRLRKNYYVPESVGIATGFLIAALHHAGLATLTHTPNPMNFLSSLLGRPDTEKPYLILVAGRPAKNATVPQHAKKKKTLQQISTTV